MNILFWFLKIITYLPIRIMYPTVVKGKKNFIKGKSILVGNHQSNADPILVFTFFWRKMNYLSKKELMNNKLTNWFFSKMGCIPVNRQKVDLSTIKLSLKALKDNKTLVIFPEGGRREESFSEDIKNGASMFALKTNSPIVPMYFVKKPRLFRFNKLIIGEPIYLDETLVGDTSKENLEKVSQIIEHTMLDLKAKYVKHKK